jgi:hypothetical protein
MNVLGSIEPRTFRPRSRSLLQGCILAGIKDGQQVRIRELGGPGKHGGAPGDLSVTVHIAERQSGPAAVSSQARLLCAIRRQPASGSSEAPLHKRAGVTCCRPWVVMARCWGRSGRLLTINVAVLLAVIVVFRLMRRTQACSRLWRRHQAAPLWPDRDTRYGCP